jgi:hypothetical protein
MLAGRHGVLLLTTVNLGLYASVQPQAKNVEFFQVFVVAAGFTNDVESKRLWGLNKASRAFCLGEMKLRLTMETMTKDKNEKSPAEEFRRIELPIEWHVPDGFVSRFANHMVIQTDGRDFFLSFFEIIPPIVVGDDADQKVKEMVSIRANCVARVIIPKERIHAFVETLNKNVGKFADIPDVDKEGGS